MTRDLNGAAPDACAGGGGFARALLESIQDGLVVHRADGSIAEVNDAFCRLSGFERAALIGERPPHAFWPQDQLPLLLPAIRRALAGERWERDFVLATRSGDRVEAIIRAAPVAGMGAEVCGCVMTVKDITHRKAHERQLAEAAASSRRRAAEMMELTRALHRSNRELDQFAYVASHDLKAPLRGIANLSRWIEEDSAAALTAETRRMLELLRGRVHRMEGLIDALLEYSRIGRTHSPVERVDVNAVVREAVELLSPPPGFVVEIAPDFPAVEASRVRLGQVFMNLLGNAIKHHRRPVGGGDGGGGMQGGRVRVGWSEAGEGLAAFHVSDDGPGIDPRYHERIFSMFQTLAPRDQVEGVGIGLALVKKIVEAAGGTIEVESAEGRGARFSFTWPRRAAAVRSCRAARGGLNEV